MSLFAVNNQKPPKPWKIISIFGGKSSSGLGDKKVTAPRKETPANPKDIKRAERINERFVAFKKELGAYYRAYALKSVNGIQIKKYVPAQLGGVDSDKFRPISNGQSVIDKMLQKRFGISLHQFETKPLSELRKIFGKAETPEPKKVEKKAEPKKVEKKAEPKKVEKKSDPKKEVSKKSASPTPKKAEPPTPKKTKMPEFKKVDTPPPAKPKTEITEAEGMKELDDIKTLITQAIANKQAA